MANLGEGPGARSPYSGESRRGTGGALSVIAANLWKGPGGAPLIVANLWKGPGVAQLIVANLGERPGARSPL